MQTVCVVKETRAGEKRVGLIPADVTLLVKENMRVIVEKDAGLGAGYLDADYIGVGAEVRDGLCDLFKESGIIVRVKRGSELREQQEMEWIKPGSQMVGALDPYENNGRHIQLWQKAGISAYSIDQLRLPKSHPLNILAAMSEIAGELAMADALSKLTRPCKKIVIIGGGTAGLAALRKAKEQGLNVMMIVSRDQSRIDLMQKGCHAISMEGAPDLQAQQTIVKHAVKDADIVITAARRPKQKAPLLITEDTLNVMQVGAVIVDLSLSEGGNVAGSQHDKTRLLGNQIIVTNVSGYPKQEPKKASILWSRASVCFIRLLINNDPEAKLALLTM